jgi:hypothetical protein
MEEIPYDDEYDNAEDSNISRYKVDDFFVTQFPPAVYVYIRYAADDGFSLFAELGTIAAAENIAEIMQNYEGVEMQIVDVRVLN